MRPMLRSTRDLYDTVTAEASKLVSSDAKACRIEIEGVQKAANTECAKVLRVCATGSLEEGVEVGGETGRALAEDQTVPTVMCDIVATMNVQSTMPKEMTRVWRESQWNEFRELVDAVLKKSACILCLQKVAWRVCLPYQAVVFLCLLAFGFARYVCDSDAACKDAPPPQFAWVYDPVPIIPIVLSFLPAVFSSLILKGVAICMVKPMSLRALHCATCTSCVLTRC